MNYLLAVRINRNQLAAIVAGMVAMLGGLSVEVVERRVHRAVLAVLRPAESTARRLIAVLARGLVVKVRKAGPGGPGGVVPTVEGVPRLALFDPRLDVDPTVKRVPGFGPNAGGFDGRGDRPPPRGPAPKDDDPVSAAKVVRRLRALLAALDDMDGQAKRLARASLRKGRPVRAMRPGRPPGYRARGRHPVDALLVECHRLALMALAEPVPP